MTEGNTSCYQTYRKGVREPCAGCGRRTWLLAARWRPSGLVSPDVGGAAVDRNAREGGERGRAEVDTASQAHTQCQEIWGGRRRGGASPGLDATGVGSLVRIGSGSTGRCWTPTMSLMPSTTLLCRSES